MYLYNNHYIKISNILKAILSNHKKFTEIQINIFMKEKTNVISENMIYY